MKYFRIWATLSLLLVYGCSMNSSTMPNIVYPTTSKISHYDTYFGTSIQDDYQWLEDDNSKETKAWVQAQNKVTFDYLSQIPFRNKLRERYAQLYDYPKVTSPMKAGENYFFYKKEGLQNQYVIYKQKGILAIPNIRGGGEYGESWHKAGMLLKKQTVFDDFISAAEYLIAEGYTKKEKLAISGRSNGGLLIGATMAQRPNLCQVAFPEVGVMDMLKFHQFTVGKGWVPEYGSSEQSEEMFKYLLGYSPYHNLKEGTTYPCTMVGTADHDDRVVPAHSFKFAARLQECHEGANPVLIRIDESAGHGSGKPTSKVIDEVTDRWAFMFYNVGIKDVVGK